MTDYDYEPTSSPKYDELLKWLQSDKYRKYNEIRNRDYMFSGDKYTKLWKAIRKVLKTADKPTLFACAVMTFSHPYDPDDDIEDALNIAYSEWRGWGKGDYGTIEYDPEKQYNHQLQDERLSGYHCCCGTKIVKECPLYHDDKDNIMKIGICCIQKYKGLSHTVKPSLAYSERKEKAKKQGLTVKELTEKEKEEKRLAEEERQRQLEIQRQLELARRELQMRREREQKEFEEQMNIRLEKQYQLQQQAIELKRQLLDLDAKRIIEERDAAIAEGNYRIRMTHNKTTERKLRDSLWKLPPDQREVKLLEYHTKNNTPINEIEDTFIFTIKCPGCKSKVMHFDKCMLMCYLCNTKITPNHTPDPDDISI